MQYPVYTIGGGDLLEDLFNGVAAIVSGSAYEQAIIITTTLGGLWLTFSYAFNVTTLKNSAVWFAGSLIAANALLVPKTTVVIIDRLNPLVPRIVDNVPFMLGTFASYTSQFGQNLTEMAEEVFSLPNDMRYSQSGFLFGGELMDSITKLSVYDQLLAVNLQEFMGTCVLMELSLGGITYDELFKSSDLFEMLNGKTLSSLRSMNYVEREGDSQVYNIYTCAEAYQKIKTLMLSPDNQDDFLLTIAEKVNEAYIKVTEGDEGVYENEATQVMLSFLPASYEFYTNESKGALAIMNHQVAINSMYNASAAFGDSYLDARTRLQTNNTFNAMGQQARDWLPIIRVIFEAIFYGMFPFIFLAFLLPNGFSIFKNYTLGFVWLQSWGPMYAIIHRAATGMQQSRIMAMTGGEGINALNQGSMVEIINSVAATAGYVTMMVPYLSLILMRGIASAGHLATSMMAVPQQAASDAALEKTTGNISLGNSNINNHQMDTTYANKHDVAFSDFRYGETFQRPDGSTVTQYGEKTVVDNKGAISNVGFDVSRSFNISNAYSNAAERNKSMAIEKTESSIKSWEQGFQDIYNSSFFENRIEGSTDSTTESNLTAEELALSTVHSEAKRVSEQYGMSIELATSLVLASTVGTPKWLPASASITAELSSKAGGYFTVDAAEDIAKNTEVRDAATVVNESIKNQVYNISDEKGNSITEELSTTFNESESQMQSATKHLSDYQSFSTRAEETKSLGFNVVYNLNQELFKYANDHNYDNSREGLEKLARSEEFIEYASHKVLDHKDERLLGLTPDDIQKSHREGSLIDPEGLFGSKKQGSLINPDIVISHDQYKQDVKTFHAEKQDIQAIDHKQFSEDIDDKIAKRRADINNESGRISEEYKNISDKAEQNKQIDNLRDHEKQETVPSLREQEKNPTKVSSLFDDINKNDETK